MLSLLLTLSCGEAPPQIEEKEDTSPILVNANTDYDMIQEEMRLVRTAERNRQAEQLQQMSIDIRKSRQQSDCILTYVKDQQQVPDGWDQPEFEEYERIGCKSLLPKIEN